MCKGCGCVRPPGSDWAVLRAEDIPRAGRSRPAAAAAQLLGGAQGPRPAHLRAAAQRGLWRALSCPPGLGQGRGEGMGAAAGGPWHALAAAALLGSACGRPPAGIVQLVSDALAAWAIILFAGYISTLQSTLEIFQRNAALAYHCPQVDGRTYSEGEDMF